MGWNREKRWWNREESGGTVRRALRVYEAHYFGCFTVLFQAVIKRIIVFIIVPMLGSSPCCLVPIEPVAGAHGAQLPMRQAPRRCWATFYTPHFTLHTLHPTFYILHFTLYTRTLHSHFPLYTVHFTLHTWHFPLYTLHFTHHTFHFPLHTLHFTLSTPHLILHTLHFTLHTFYSTCYTLHSTLYTPFLLSHNYDSGVPYMLSYVWAFGFVGFIFSFFCNFKVQTPLALPDQQLGLPPWRAPHRGRMATHCHIIASQRLEHPSFRLLVLSLGHFWTFGSFWDPMGPQNSQ